MIGIRFFSTEVDEELQAFGLKVLRTPVQAPKANAYCERLMGDHPPRVPGLRDPLQ